MFLPGRAMGEMCQSRPKPQVAFHSQGGYSILFGTGRFLDASDRGTAPAVNSLYGIWDDASTFGIKRANLKQQQITQVSTTGRGISGAVPDWTTQRGWFTDLNIASGERDVTDPQLQFGVAFFTTINPGLCADGDGFFMTLDPVTGLASQVLGAAAPAGQSIGNSGSSPTLIAIPDLPPPTGDPAPPTKFVVLLPPGTIGPGVSSAPTIAVTPKVPEAKGRLSFRQITNVK